MTFELAVGPQLSVRTIVEKGRAGTCAGNNPSQFFVCGHKMDVLYTKKTL